MEAYLKEGWNQKGAQTDRLRDRKKSNQLEQKWWEQKEGVE